MPCAVGQLHAPTAPAPSAPCLARQQTASLVRQGAEHLKRQPCAGSAVRTRAHALHTQALSGALCRPGVNRLLAGTILLQRLLHEHRQADRGRIQPLAVLGQIPFGHLKQLRTGQHVEEVDRAGLANLPPDARSMLLRLKVGITINQGWPRGCSDGCVVTTILSIQASLPPSISTSYPRQQHRSGLSKCHCA